MLPGEQATRRYLTQRFAADFKLATRVLKVGYVVHDSLCAESVSRFSALTKAICVGAYTKLCKQYRSIHALCELGLTDDAEILVRSMFESSMVILFLLRRRVVLRHGKRRPPRPPGGRLTVDFRASLYAADQALQEQKKVNGWLSTHGLKRHAKNLKKFVDEWVAAESEVIGPDWMAWLKKGTVFGLKIEAMASNLGLRKWYAGIYRPQCSKVHAADAVDHLDWDNALAITPKLGADAECTTEPIRLANVPFLIATDLIDDRFRLGHHDQIKAIADAISG